jgi:hypothetical protein
VRAPGRYRRPRLDPFAAWFTVLLALVAGIFVYTAISMGTGATTEERCAMYRWAPMKNVPYACLEVLDRE